MAKRILPDSLVYGQLSFSVAHVSVCCCRCLNSHHASDQSTGFGRFWSRMMKADNKNKSTYQELDEA